jgi:hypothetical protein
VRTPALFVSVLVVLAGCGDTDAGPVTAGGAPADDRRLTASTTVLESEGHGPQLCLGGVMDSYPPQCGGPDIVGWDWEAVEGEEAANGTTWGTYTVVGTWDGTRFTLTEPPGPPTPGERRPMDLSTPCPPPAGGWAVVDPTRLDGQAAALEHAHAQPDFAGAWLDQSINPASATGSSEEMNDPAKLVLNLRFTGDLARHEAEAREAWGGALCVSGATRSIADLEAVQRELGDQEGTLSSSIDVTRGVVELAVMVAEPEWRRSLDERYGEGTVEVTGALRPVP